MTTYYSTSFGWTVTTYVFIVYDLIWLPFVTYHLYVYYLHRKYAYFKPRMSKATIIFAALVILSALHRLVDALMGIGFLPHDWIIGTLIAYIQLFPIYALYLYKAWFTLYQYRRSQVVADSGWEVLLMLGSGSSPPKNSHVRRFSSKTAVSAAHVSPAPRKSVLAMKYNSHWTIKYTQTLGNKRFVARLLSLPLLVLSLATVVSLCWLYYVQNEAERYMWIYDVCTLAQSLILLFSCTVVPILVLWKVSSLTDLLDVKQELVSLSLSMLLMGVVSGMWLVVVALHDTDDQWQLTFVDVKIYFFASVSFVGSLMCFCVISRVVWKFDKKLVVGRCGGVQTRPRVLSKSLTNNFEAERDENTNRIKYRLEHIISHPVAYRVLMRHLVDEYALEGLLFYTEAMQYKYRTQVFESLHTMPGLPSQTSTTSNASFDGSAVRVGILHTSDTLHAAQNTPSTEVAVGTLSDLNSQKFAIAGPASMRNTARRMDSVPSGVATPSSESAAFESESHHSAPDGTPGPPVRPDIIINDGTGGDASDVATVQAPKPMHTRKGSVARRKKKMNVNVRAFPRIPDNVPESNIMKTENVMDRAEMIVNRYIVDSGELQVNISFLIRKRLIEKRGTLRKMDREAQLSAEQVEWLYQFFDESCVEILSLLRGSFGNFVQTEAYSKLEKEMLKEHI